MTYKTPGVYLQEIDAFGATVVGVATAEPAFIGYTETAWDPKGGKAIDVPIRISSLAEYQTYFGGPAPWRFRVVQTLSTTPAFAANIAMPDGTVISSGFDLMRVPPASGPDRFCLHTQMQVFFANGGRTCWVMSAGSTATPGATITASGLLAALATFEPLIGPTMLVVPEACQLSQADYAEVASAMLAQASRLQDRVAIFDLPGCSQATDLAALTVAQQNLWDVLAPQVDHRSYGVAYGPALATTIVQPQDVGIPVLAGDDNRTINALLTTQAVQLYDGSHLAALQPAIAAAFPVAGVTTNTPVLSGDASAYPAPVAPGPAGLAAWQQQLGDLLMDTLPIFSEIAQLVADYLNVQPPSGALAGIWTNTDTQSGVWNAPANVAVASVAAPLCPIDDREQAAFNAPVNGMAINILRTFPSRGTVVWGARTLDANSPDYRYVPVRRTLIYVEQSIKLALERYTFAPNDTSTWVTVNAMVSNFLDGLWREGGLTGAKPSEAYAVQCGLGTTMTAADVANGTMVVSVMLSILRPAEFIVLQFQQAMQAS